MHLSRFPVFHGITDKIFRILCWTRRRVSMTGHTVLRESDRPGEDDGIGAPIRQKVLLRSRRPEIFQHG